MKQTINIHGIALTGLIRWHLDACKNKRVWVLQMINSSYGFRAPFSENENINQQTSWDLSRLLIILIVLPSLDPGLLLPDLLLSEDFLLFPSEPLTSLTDSPTGLPVVILGSQSGLGFPYGRFLFWSLQNVPIIILVAKIYIKCHK